jgi:hypothetical protein
VTPTSVIESAGSTRGPIADPSGAEFIRWPWQRGLRQDTSARCHRPNLAATKDQERLAREDERVQALQQEHERAAALEARRS